MASRVKRDRTTKADSCSEEVTTGERVSPWDFRGERVVSRIAYEASDPHWGVCSHITSRVEREIFRLKIRQSLTVKSLAYGECW